MTERSYYWQALVTGDATLAPYEDFTYANNWQKLFTREDNQGVLRDYLNELVVGGVSGGASVNTGFAIVNGWVYENTTSVTKTISTPSSNPRIDVVVARMTFVDTEIRIFVIEGTEAGSPTAPSLIQNNNVVWDIPLAEVLIDTAGTITITDTREFATTPLAEQPAMTLIEEIVSVSAGLPVEFVFEDIPQNFRNLIVIGQWRGNSSIIAGQVFFNDDEVSTNYWKQVLNSDGVGLVVAPLNFETIILLDEPTLATNEAISFGFTIQNYAGTTFYKNLIQDEVAMGVLGAGAGQPLASEGLVWMNTDAITKIRITAITGTILEDSKISLYGL
jgi:hypothetical protein